MFLQAACARWVIAKESRMKTFKERYEWATSSCRKARMRLTPVREAILSFLAQRRTPATLEMVSQADGVRGQCDSTTVYRTLMMFKEAELARLVGTPGKASCFVLNVPGEDAHFLICRRCGCIAEMPLPHGLSAAIGRIASAHGFSLMPQDCEIYGLCADCQAARKAKVFPAKLTV